LGFRVVAFQLERLLDRVRVERVQRGLARAIEALRLRIDAARLLGDDLCANSDLHPGGGLYRCHYGIEISAPRRSRRLRPGLAAARAEPARPFWAASPSRRLSLLGSGASSSNRSPCDATGRQPV